MTIGCGTTITLGHGNGVGCGETAYDRQWLCNACKIKDLEEKLDAAQERALILEPTLESVKYFETQLKEQLDSFHKGAIHYGDMLIACEHFNTACMYLTRSLYPGAMR